MPLVPLKAATILGSVVGSLADLRALLALAKAGRLPALPVEVRPLADIAAILARLNAGGIVGRTVVRP